MYTELATMGDVVTDTTQKVSFAVQGSTAILTLNRPEKINAMDGDVYEAIEAIAARVANDPEIRALVITGAGGNFSAGGDLKWLQEMHEKYDQPGKPWNYGFEAYEVLKKLEKPVIAAIDGYCVASAFNLAILYCDIRVMSSRAKLGLPGPKRGLGIGPYPMPWERYTGLGNIMYLALTGKHLTGDEALRMGLVNEVVEAEDLLPRALELAALVTEGNAQEISGLKEFWRTYPELPGGSYMLVAEQVRRRIDSKRTDNNEGRRAFLEGRDPNWNTQ